jgi:predicted component of type VI protein secretion system
MERTLSIKSKMVIYIPEKFKEEVINYRKKYDENLDDTIIVVQELEELGFTASDNGKNQIFELPAGTTEAEAQAMVASLSLRSQDEYSWQTQGGVFTDIKDGKRRIMVPFGGEAYIDTAEVQIFNEKLLEARTRIALEFWNAKQEAGFDTLTPDQVKKFDLDGNGKVTAYDLQQIGINDPTAAQNLLFDSNVINDQGVVLSEEERRIQVAKKVHFDKDNDGIAEYKETRTLTAAEIAKLDIDGDGKVTKADLATIHANDAAKSWHEHLVSSGVITADGTVLTDQQRTARAEAKEVAITANSSPEAAQNLKEGEVKKLDIDGNSKVTVDDLAVVYGYDTAREKQQVLVDNGLITKDGAVRTDAERDTEKADAKLVSDTQKKFDDLLKERAAKLAFPVGSQEQKGESELQYRMQLLAKDPFTPEELKQPMVDQLQQQNTQSMQLDMLLKQRKELIALQDSGKDTVKKDVPIDDVLKSIEFRIELNQGTPSAQLDALLKQRKELIALQDRGQNTVKTDVLIYDVLKSTEYKIKGFTLVGGEMAIAAQDQQIDKERNIARQNDSDRRILLEDRASALERGDAKALDAINAQIEKPENREKFGTQKFKDDIE